MAWQRRHVDARIGEQPALNYVLRRTPGVRYKILPRAKYPNGARGNYFDREPPPALDHKYAPVIVHNNWLGGMDNKRARFKEYGLWYAYQRDATDEERQRGGGVPVPGSAPGRAVWACHRVVSEWGPFVV